MDARRDPGAKQHPAVAAQQRLLGALCVLFALVSVAFALAGVGMFWFSLPTLAIASFLGWAVWRLPRQGRAVQLYNAALASLLRGQDEEVLRLLGQISPAEMRRGPLAVGVETQRAIVAFHQGDSERAVALASVGLSRPRSRVFLAAPHEDLHRAKGTAMRALAHASLGHEKDAEMDAAAAESSLGATPDILGRAALARSVILARQNDRPALASHLQKTSGLMLEWLTPRERSLVRALRLMARTQVRSVYRESARPDDRSADAHLASWMGKLVPGAEAFAREAASPGAPSSELPTAAAAPEALVANVKRAHKGKRAKLLRRTLVLWLLLMVMFGTVWEVLGDGTPAAESHRAVAAVTIAAWTFWAMGLAISAFVGLIAYQLWIMQKRSRDLARAQLAIARGDVAGAAEQLRVLTRGRAVGVAAAAHLSLAHLSLRKMEWNDAIRQADAGIAKLVTSAALRGVHSDLLLPELVATRAFALAASDRPDEAKAEMSVVHSDYPGYLLLASADFRVRLAIAVRAGDLDGASRVAMTRSTDMPLSLRDDMLADVVLAATTPLAEDERERIDAELSDDAELRAWIDAVAPGLRQRSRVRVADEKRVALGAPSEIEDDSAPEEASRRQLVQGP